MIWNFDIYFYRYRREDAYVGRLYEFPSRNIVEEDGEGSNNLIFILETTLLEEARGSFAYFDRRTKINRQVIMLLADRTFRLKIWNKNGYLIPVNCHEAAVISRAVMKYLNVLCTNPGGGRVKKRTGGGLRWHPLYPIWDSLW